MQTIRTLESRCSSLSSQLESKDSQLAQALAKLAHKPVPGVPDPHSVIPGRKEKSFAKSKSYDWRAVQRAEVQIDQLKVS